VLVTYGLPVVLFGIGFLLGRRTTILSSLKPSAETSAAWQNVK